jgi:hypothetical protein
MQTTYLFHTLDTVATHMMFMAPSVCHRVGRLECRIPGLSVALKIAQHADHVSEDIGDS